MSDRILRSRNNASALQDENLVEQQQTVQQQQQTVQQPIVQQQIVQQQTRIHMTRVNPNYRPTIPMNDNARPYLSIEMVKLNNVKTVNERLIL
jgi:hypothetical protein